MEISSPGGSVDSTASEGSDVELYSMDERSRGTQRNGMITYQASSPDEVISTFEALSFGVFWSSSSEWPPIRIT